MSLKEETTNIKTVCEIKRSEETDKLVAMHAISITSACNEMRNFCAESYDKFFKDKKMDEQSGLTNQEVLDMLEDTVKIILHNFEIAGGISAYLERDKKIAKEIARQLHLCEDE